VNIAQVCSQPSILTTAQKLNFLIFTIENNSFYCTNIICNFKLLSIQIKFIKNVSRIVYSAEIIREIPYVFDNV